MAGGNFERLLNYMDEDKEDEAIQLIRTGKIEMTSVDYLGRTCLMHAARRGRRGLVKEVIKQYTDAGMVDIYGQTALHYAVDNNSIDIVNYLIQSGLDVNSMRTLSPMHIAAIKGYTEVAQTLISANCDINLQNRSGITALHCACSNNHLQVVQLLLSHGASVNITTNIGRSALAMAVEASSKDIIQELVKHRARVNITDTYGLTALCTACLHNNTDIATFLIDHNAYLDVADNKGNLPIHYCSRAGNVVVTDHLLQHGSPTDVLNKDAASPLHLAATQGHTEVINALVKYGCNTNVCDNHKCIAPIHTAVSSLTDPLVFAETVQLLVSGGCDLDKVANTIWGTSLYLATNQSQGAFALVLLQHGANPQIEDGHNVTLLHNCCRRRLLSVVQTLIYAGLVDWTMETWLNQDIYDSGITPSLLQGYPADIPMALLKNVDLYFEIVHVRNNPLQLASLVRKQVRLLLKNNVVCKLQQLCVPKRLQDFLMLKIV